MVGLSHAAVCLIAVSSAYLPVCQEYALAQAQKQPRRVYVLHSGVHTILADPVKNAVAQHLAVGLRRRGVPARDIIVLPNPFPTASWQNMFPYECMTMFVESATPKSKVSQESYLRMHKALQSRSVTADDTIVWIGHSAGGQMGLTMAHLARNLHKHPKLAKSTKPYSIEMVVTLGTPIASNPVPAGVKVRHYYSPADKIVRWVSQIGPPVLKTIGRPISITVVPPNLRPGDLIRIFTGIDHAYWAHDDRVFDRILLEATNQQLPLWQASDVLGRGLDATLLRMVAKSVQLQSNIVLEDPPKSGKSD